MSVEQFISTLQMDDKLKGHLLLRQANLEPLDKSMIVGASSGKYDVCSIVGALRQDLKKLCKSPPFNEDQ